LICAQFFCAEELEVLVSGTEELDFKALERVATYKNGYSASSRVIRWFWEVRLLRRLGVWSIEITFFRSPMLSHRRTKNDCCSLSLAAVEPPSRDLDHCLSSFSVPDQTLSGNPS
jgi:hypothetical protein